MPPGSASAETKDSCITQKDARPHLDADGRTDPRPVGRSPSEWSALLARMFAEKVAVLATVARQHGSAGGLKKFHKCVGGTFVQISAIGDALLSC